MTSETSKHRSQFAHFCQGNGIDIGSGGDPVVPHAIQIDLPEVAFRSYGHCHPVFYPIQFRGDACDLPFLDGVLDFVYSSHLLEDYEHWFPLLNEWTRVLKPGGYFIILLPDKQRFEAARIKGGGGNLNHKHEAHVGELSTYFTRQRIGATDVIEGFEVVEDRFANKTNDEDYNILFIARKLCEFEI